MGTDEAAAKHALYPLPGVALPHRVVAKGRARSSCRYADLFCLFMLGELGEVGGNATSCLAPAASVVVPWCALETRSLASGALSKVTFWL